MMKKVWYSVLLLSVCFVSQAQQKALLKYLLKNPIPNERKDAPVLLSAKEILKKVKGSFVIKDVSSGTEIPYQWIYNGNKTPQELLLMTDFAPEQIKNIAFYEGVPAPVPTRTYARYVPERYEDYAWENDKIAFRMYGKALEANPDENAYGLDVWAKKTPNLVINKWYKTADYHHDHGEGLDFFSVGHTLGAGDALPYMGDTLNYLGNYTTHQMLDSGALRSSFRLIYPSVKIGKYTVSAIKTITIDAGSQLNKEEIEYHFKGGQQLPIFAGIVYWNGKGEKYSNSATGVASYWEPAHGKVGTIGTGVLFPDKGAVLIDAHKHLGAKILLNNGQKYTYYNGGAWDKAGVITNAKDWEAYLNAYSEKIKFPIVVEKR